MGKKRTIMLIAGARPNFMKIAPLIAALRTVKRFSVTLVHTGQHYDEKMSKVFFDELHIPRPDINLEVGSDTQGAQTGKIMIEFDRVVEKKKPDLVVVVGDVNSTVACALVAVKRGTQVAHVEAGLRSFDWQMPEEVNRVLTDRLANFLFCTEESALKNLKKEGIHPKKIFFVGNVMIDTLLTHRKTAEKSSIIRTLSLTGKHYAVATLHRPANVDDPKNLKKLLSILTKTAQIGLSVIFPIHPRTKKNMERWRLQAPGITFIEPIGYLDFLKLMSHATLVLTDSGGIQEETTILGVPCLTLRENTERPVTVTAGTNQIIGMNGGKALAAVRKILANPARLKRAPKYWDGKAARRIAKILNQKL